jgi:hypothetical protein
VLLVVAVLVLVYNTLGPSTATTPAMKKLPRKLADRGAASKLSAQPDSEAAVAQQEQEAEAEAEERKKEAKPLRSAARGFYRFSAEDIDGETRSLSEYAGKARALRGSEELPE